MRKIAFLALSFLTLLPALPRAQTPAPEGWRFPGDADYVDDWLAHRETHPVPFRVGADFNGDGATDNAWIVISKKGDAGGLCVLLARSPGPPEVVWLDKGKMVFKPQRVAIAAVPPGKYRTACGKGYFECDAGEPGELDLSLPSFELVYFGKTSVLFWWDAARRSFRATTMSD